MNEKKHNLLLDDEPQLSLAPGWPQLLESQDEVGEAWMGTENLVFLFWYVSLVFLFLGFLSVRQRAAQIVTGKV